MTTMTDASRLNLINDIDEKTGASVGMWRNVNTAPIEWGQLLTQHNGTRDFTCTECGHYGNSQVPECTCPGCDA